MTLHGLAHVGKPTSSYVGCDSGIGSGGGGAGGGVGDGGGAGSAPPCADEPGPTDSCTKETPLWVGALVGFSSRGTAFS